MMPFLILCRFIVQAGRLGKCLVQVHISSAECYSVLCPFLTKMSIIYRWNQHQMFYLQSSLDVAYHISMRIYKLFNLASLPKNDFTLVLYCSMSILNQ